MKKLVLVCLVALSAGCDSIFGGDDDENFTFSAQRIDYTSDMQDQAEAFAVGGSIYVDGIIILPHPCFNVKGSLRRNGEQIDVLIEADRNNATTCPAVVQAMEYRIAAFSVPRGLYRVRVQYEIANELTLINEINVNVE